MMFCSNLGGKEMVFQTGPEHPWLIKTYAEVAPHPCAQVFAQDLFQSGVIPSDTDFRIYRVYGKIPGKFIIKCSVDNQPTVQQGYLIAECRFSNVAFYATYNSLGSGNEQYYFGLHVSNLLYYLGLSTDYTDSYCSCSHLRIIGLLWILHSEKYPCCLQHTL